MGEGGGEQAKNRRLNMYHVTEQKAVKLSKPTWTFCYLSVLLRFKTFVCIYIKRKFITNVYFAVDRNPCLFLVFHLFFAFI